MRLPGLWIGKLFFEILLAIVYYLVIYLVDWQNIIDKTQERIEQDKKALENLEDI